MCIHNVLNTQLKTLFLSVLTLSLHSFALSLISTHTNEDSRLTFSCVSTFIVIIQTNDCYLCCLANILPENHLGKIFLM